MNPTTTTDSQQFRPYEGGRIRGDFNANGIPDGQVEYIFDDSDGNVTMYTGMMSCGREHGRGRLEFYDHSSLDGFFHLGKAVSGTVRNPDGRIIYEGQYDIYDTYIGNGTQYLPDGSIYVGNFKRGKKHGQGVMTYSNGDCYEGNWVEDCRDGIGEYRFSSAHCSIKSISGTWLNDRPSAPMALEYNLPPDSVFVGQFQQGMRHGPGELTYVDGTSYSGEWVNGKREGYGELRFAADNTVIAVLSGKWVNDKPISPMTLKVNSIQIDKMTNVVNETGADAKINETVVDKVTNPPQQSEKRVGGENLGDQPHVAPRNFKWVCDICNKAKFRTFKEAMEHEDNCTDSTGTVHECT